MTIRELLDLYEKKKTNPREIASEYFKRIKASKLNAFLATCEERVNKQLSVLEEAALVEKRIPQDRFPLYGIPIGIKDALHVKGVRSTAGSKILENYIAPFSATCVERLERAGAILLGKLNMDEFAMGSSNENSAFGPVSHPTHPGYVPGGSSGGSAAAVKANLCLAALGSDTGGSIRLPASFCGVVGVKPTYGRVSRFGLIAYASSLDQVGPLTNSVEDSARVLDVIVGPDHMDSTSAPVLGARWTESILASKQTLKGLKVGLPKEFLSDGLSSEVQKSIQSAVDVLKKRGAKIVDVSLPHAPYALSVYYVIAVSEASSNLARYDGIRFGSRLQEDELDLEKYYRKVRSQFGSEVKRRILLGTFALSTGYYDAFYLRACRVRRLIQQDFEKAFEKVDLLMGPVSPTTAFKQGERISDPLQMYLADTLTIPANLAGLPAMSVPWAEGSNGLPIGIQWIGKPLGEEGLLQAAHLFEKERGELS